MEKNSIFAQMKDLGAVLKQLILFLVFSTLMFLCQFLFERWELVYLEYKIHFLLFFITFIGVVTALLLYLLGRRDVLGFVFLGFVVFKLFAMGYIALFESDFKKKLLVYFLIYWFYLVAEVFVLVKLMQKTGRKS